jgi:hypothetical protein
MYNGYDDEEQAHAAEVINSFRRREMRGRKGEVKSERDCISGRQGYTALPHDEGGVEATASGL